ncbi:hypothetical protein JOD43_002566 [Pullulanibacillus pueri]|uniref:Lipoprotein n=1 Tax=Pullulanibacillus pueri TaxID=1437324 RepID=A0A8J3EM29_9BACL|nr:YkyA family protein [Pullulanibacillus pueri]MBM7682389.1 hypothetical protein [Pullulanibacillus pueri]GGH81829.1 hypothetical protein GCM10007096_20310 [Pullulanibacillus pueri]
MKIFKSLRPAPLLILVIFVMTGCHHDQKQAEKLHVDLEKSAQIEQRLAKHQESLTQNSTKERKAYKTLLALQIDQNQDIHATIKKAQHYNEEQRRTLNDCDKIFNQGYSLATNAKPLIKDIKDSKQKEAGLKVLKLIEMRHQLYHTYSKEYRHVLDLNDKAYKRLSGESDIEVKKLEDNIKKINQAYKNLDNKKEQFNRYTTQYNQAKWAYYQKAGLQVKQVQN